MKMLGAALISTLVVVGSLASSSAEANGGRGHRGGGHHAHHGHGHGFHGHGHGRHVHGPRVGVFIGAPLVADSRIAGVAFTESVETARHINRALAAREGPIVPLIAETGGLNAMIVDSSALPEQVVTDTIISAFQSAGQRCSALRVLAVQAPIADRVLAMLSGAMRELRLGDPAEPDTDVGPVIDVDALAALDKHRAYLASIGKLIGETPRPPVAPKGLFFPPIAFELPLTRSEERV